MLGSWKFPILAAQARRAAFLAAEFSTIALIGVLLPWQEVSTASGDPTWVRIYEKSGDPSNTWNGLQLGLYGACTALFELVVIAALGSALLAKKPSTRSTVVACVGSGLALTSVALELVLWSPGRTSVPDLELDRAYGVYLTLLFGVLSFLLCLRLLVVARHASRAQPEVGDER